MTSARDSVEGGENGGYVSIPRRFIAPDIVTGVNLYLKVSDRYVLYRSGEERVDAESLAKLQSRQVETLYVRAGQREQLEDYIATHAERMLAAAVTPEQQSQVLREATSAVLRSALHRLDEHGTFERVRRVSDLVVERIAEDAALLPGLVRFGGGNERLFTHSANVAAYSVALAARQAEFRDEQLASIGLGAIVHDLALARVDPALLDRPVQDCTQMERDLLARHPRRGAVILEQAGVADPIVLDIVRHHHGPEDEGAAAGRISPVAQIVMLADVFDSLTNQPGARDRQGPFAALYEMRHRMEGRFPPELIRDFVLMLGAIASVDLESPIAPLSRRPHPRAGERAAA